MAHIQVLLDGYSPTLWVLHLGACLLSLPTNTGNSNTDTDGERSHCPLVGSQVIHCSPNQILQCPLIRGRPSRAQYNQTHRAQRHPCEVIPSSTVSWCHANQMISCHPSTAQLKEFQKVISSLVRRHPVTISSDETYHKIRSTIQSISLNQLFPTEMLLHSLSPHPVPHHFQMKNKKSSHNSTHVTE